MISTSYDPELSYSSYAACSKLQDLRDERASILGRLVHIKDDLVSALDKTDVDDQFTGFKIFIHNFAGALDVDATNTEGEALSLTQFPILLTRSVLPTYDRSHREYISQLGLQRPSRITLIWPKLVFVPPMFLLAARSLYQSRDSLRQMAYDAIETLKGFWEDWLLGPLKDVVKTVRAGSGDGVIITKESVKADLEVLYASIFHYYYILTRIPVSRKDGTIFGSRKTQLYPGTNGRTFTASPSR